MKKGQQSPEVFISMERKGLMKSILLSLKAFFSTMNFLDDFKLENISIIGRQSAPQSRGQSDIEFDQSDYGNTLPLQQSNGKRKAMTTQRPNNFIWAIKVLSSCKLTVPSDQLSVSRGLDK